MKKLLVLGLMFSFPLLASAATQYIYVKEIGVIKWSGVTYAIIQLDGNLTSVPSCASSYSNQVSFPIQDSYFGETTYSTALSAVVSQKQVYIDYSNSTCGLWGSRPLANRIDVMR